MNIICYDPLAKSVLVELVFVNLWTKPKQKFSFASTRYLATLVHISLYIIKLFPPNRNPNKKSGLVPTISTLLTFKLVAFRVSKKEINKTKTIILLITVLHKPPCCCKSHEIHIKLQIARKTRHARN